MTETSIRIQSRFQGPDGMGNGGYVSGVVAQALGKPADVRLFAPTPLDRELRLECAADHARLWDGDGRLVEATPRPTPLNLALPPAPTDSEIAQAAEYFPSVDEHMAPRCFVCGSLRDSRDALCLLTGRHPDSGRTLTKWTPADDLADTAGLVEERFMWAALDCPSYFAIPPAPRAVALLAGYSVDIIRRPMAGEQLRVTGWPLGSEGRKHRAATVIHDAGGNAIALSRALWVELAA